MLGDLNAQLGRSIPGVTGKYTVRRETKGKHGKSLVQLMRNCKMFACCTDDQAGRPPEPKARHKRRSERAGRKKKWEAIPKAQRGEGENRP
eukprot:SAG25_NODE_9574_length_367_cov_0.944030_1_plen_90_part_10